MCLFCFLSNNYVLHVRLCRLFVSMQQIKCHLPPNHIHSLLEHLFVQIFMAKIGQEHTNTQYTYSLTWRFANRSNMWCGVIFLRLCYICVYVHQNTQSVALIYAIPNTYIHHSHPHIGAPASPLETEILVEITH